MVGLIFKISYNNPDDNNLTGGICGSAFFISKNTILTAHHLLNKSTFIPNLGFSNCQVWFISENNLILELQQGQIELFPNLDSTLVRLSDDLDINHFELNNDDVSIGDSCSSYGFNVALTPALDISWEGLRLKIRNVNLASSISNRVGYIKRQLTIDVSSIDVNMNGVLGIETSFSGVVGMSGGPLTLSGTNIVIGMMSIGLPMDVHDKTSVFAVSSKNLIQIMS